MCRYVNVNVIQQLNEQLHRSGQKLTNNLHYPEKRSFQAHGKVNIYFFIFLDASVNPDNVLKDDAENYGKTKNSFERRNSCHLPKVDEN